MIGRKLILTGLISVVLLANARADEGMWIPLLLEQLNEKEMQEMGFKLTAEDIYSINSSSMKDGIVIFGGGCTGELVSDQGLLLTNHHCGYGSIQRHSTLENDYLTDGFWAMSREEELPNPNLTVTFLVSMKDVTDEMLYTAGNPSDGGGAPGGEARLQRPGGTARRGGSVRPDRQRLRHRALFGPRRTPSPCCLPGHDRRCKQQPDSRD